MLKWIALFSFLPTLAMADWAPRPLLFTYEATFAQCIADPGTPNLGAQCLSNLKAAYALKRAVAHAALVCADQPFDTCNIPFEEEGLPATAARIAHSIGCNTADIAQLPANATMPLDHCVTVTADILSDEGVVPLVTAVGCGLEGTECRELAQINAAFWMDQVDAAAPADPVINDLLMRNSQDCAAADETAFGAAQLNAQICEANRAAALWADIVQHQVEQ